MSFTDVDTNGDLEIHIKYCGQWMMMTAKKNVAGKDLIQEIELLSLALQRTIDKVSRGETEKNIIPVKDDSGIGR